MKPTDFTKMYDQLIGIGLPPRLVLLYGKLRYHAGNDGRCFPKHSTLAKEIGLTSRTSHEHVLRLLRELQRLRLIRWRRGRYSNAYQVLEPDPAFLSGQIRHESRISDPTRMSDRKDKPAEKISRKESVVQPASLEVPEAGGLDESLTGIWQHLPGRPGTKLLEQIATVLGDAPIEHFRALLIARRRIARSFGLALALATETRKRWDADAAAYKQAGEAELRDHIRRAEAAVADTDTPAEELPDLMQYLSDLRQQMESMQGASQARCKPQCESKTPAERKRSA